MTMLIYFFKLGAVNDFLVLKADLDIFSESLIIIIIPMFKFIRCWPQGLLPSLLNVTRAFR
jgi:hypothetical protein